MMIDHWEDEIQNNKEHINKKNCREKTDQQ